MGMINAEWHRTHLMPKNPTESERAQWHYDHAMHCGCREITPSIAALLKANGLNLPKPARTPG